VFDRSALRAIGTCVTDGPPSSVHPPTRGWVALDVRPGCTAASVVIISNGVIGCVPGCSAIDSGVNAVITVCDKNKDALLGQEISEL
jgi:hypothetical protein